VRGLIVGVVAVMALAGASLAFAESSSCSTCSPWWHLGSGARPSHLVAGSEGELVATAENVGDAEAMGESSAGGGPIKIVDTLPAGLRAVGVAGAAPARGGDLSGMLPLSCSLESTSNVSCTFGGEVVPYDLIEVRIKVEVSPDAASGEVNEVGISGGGAPSAQIARPVTIGAEPTPFGVEDYELTSEAEGGVGGGGGGAGSDLQAGSHPFQVTGTIALNQGPDTAPLSSGPQAGPAALAKDVVARLPVGLIADDVPVPHCGMLQFERHYGGEGHASKEEDECTRQTAVGVASVTVDEPGGSGTFTFAAPVFNLEPNPGEPARFGFLVPIVDVPVVLDTSVRSGPGEDWGVDLSTGGIPESVGLTSVRVTFWGVPERSAHNDSRGWGCLALTRGAKAVEPCPYHFEEQHPPAFLTMPASCTGPLQSSVEADSWAAPGDFQSFAPSAPLGVLEGCGEIAFTPTVEAQPTTHSASSPSGLSFDLGFNDEGLLSATGIAQSDLEKTVVTLPEGVTIDPSAGVGLGACTPAQYAEASVISPPPPGVGCPEDSKLGTVEIETPLLGTVVYGSLYVAQPYANPFGSLVAIYVVARSRAERGILVKLAGNVTPNPVTGRLTIAFENDPQVPFDRFNFHFREGQQAPLITPATCGTYTTRAELTPWANPTEVLTDTSSFQVTSGSEGAACPGAVAPFAPAIGAATVDDDAGTFSPFYVELSRTDAMQEIASFSAGLPEGLTGDLSGIPFCPEADVEAARRRTGEQEQDEPSCPAASEIGHSLVGTGVGAVLDYVPGRLYLAGPFHGDPLSVVSVTSAVIGPFDLGTVVIRFALRIDPYTAQVSIDPTGSEPIPTIIDGIVTHVRDIRVSIDRPDFTLNPTSCNPHPTSSTLTSTEGASATVSTPYQAANCDELKFKPRFKVSTSARTSRANGASLHVKLTVPGALGTQANIGQVKVDLPKQLPSRLATLQKACTNAQFEANPAGCPKASKIGYAKAITPLIPVPLVGPAIFVSHGGEAFPSLVVVLQGYGVTIDLVGSTFISKAGITSSTFKTVPDQPVGSFELTLPEGPYSALAALGNLCRQKLVMPTVFVAQNGATIHKRTRIAVTGCHAHVRKKRRRHGVGR
jgi:hypothetical protein